MFLLNVRDQVSHPYRTTQHYSLVYSNFYAFRWQVRRQNVANRM
jgi:hypothetical protein